MPPWFVITMVRIEDIHLRRNENNEALEYYLSSDIIGQQIDDKTLEAETSFNLGKAYNFSGDYFNMTAAFLSTFMGLLIFQKTHRFKYNIYFRIFLGSFIASICASLGIIYNIGAYPQTALATSILFLVPGVALINSFTDLLDNNILNGMVRFTTGLMIVLAMAIGLFVAMYIFQLN